MSWSVGVLESFRVIENEKSIDKILIIQSTILRYY